MDSRVSELDAGRPVRDAFDAFERTGFGFVPVMINQRVVTSLSMRDVLRLAIESKLKTTVGELSSPIIAITGKTSIGSALELMLEQSVRCLVVRESGRDAILNDRIMLEYLLSYAGRKAVSSKGLEGLFDTEVNVLDPVEPSTAEANTPASVAATRLLDLNTPCLLLESGSIVTPWDIVMKGLAGRI
jgi:CBS domain-containing protein